MTASEIAEKLTDNQREVVLALPSTGEWRRAINFSGKAATRLRDEAAGRPALVDRRIERSRNLTTFRLNELGIAVRDHLKNGKGR